MVTRFISMPNKKWEEWRANWCFVRFDEEDDSVAYAEPMGFPKPSTSGPLRRAWLTWRLQWRGSRTFVMNKLPPITW
jgi:hypothetical protein